MKASDIMGRPVVAAAKTTTARDVAIQMLMGGFSGMPITERDGTILGIVSEFDIIHAIREGKSVETTMAGDIMTTDVASVDVNDSVEKVLEILDTRRVLRVPVTNTEAIGVISRPDILRAFIEPNFMTFD
jgi:CBS domain-containing protein